MRRKRQARSRGHLLWLLLKRRATRVFKTVRKIPSISRPTPSSGRPTSLTRCSSTSCRASRRPARGRRRRPGQLAQLHHPDAARPAPTPARPSRPSGASCGPSPTPPSCSSSSGAASASSSGADEHPYHEAMELLPRLVLGALLVNTSLSWAQLAIDLNNALCSGHRRRRVSPPGTRPTPPRQLLVGSGRRPRSTSSPASSSSSRC